MSLEYWDKLKQPPEWALGKIAGGKLSGKTDINPQWRIQAMTETFGICGIGWKFNETARQYVDGANGEKMVFIDIDLFVNVGGKWSAPIPGRGGDFIADTEKGKLVSNDEAVKMATTDALGNAMKYLGMAAVIYSKGNDGTKYSRKSADPQPNTPPKQNNLAPANSGAKNQQENGPLLFKMKHADGKFTMEPIENLSNSQIEWYAKNAKDEKQKEAANDFILQNAERFVDAKKNQADGQEAGTTESTPA
jgi:hypothetical protein